MFLKLGIKSPKAIIFFFNKDDNSTKLLKYLKLLSIVKNIHQIFW